MTLFLGKPRGVLLLVLLNGHCGTLRGYTVVPVLPFGVHSVGVCV